ncbi:MAG: WavE lipopolysaccharide synthesis family protein [bacterium]|nr:WavE lipopolysaccharide synthesis family protein [bacterium]
MTFKNYIKINILNKSLKSFLSFVEKRRGAYITFHERPVRPSLLRNFHEQPEKKLPPTAIVIQGPILKTNDFTLESVKLYRKNFSQSLIIVSTWKDEDPEYLEKIKKEGATIVLCDKPSYPGPKNLNMQLVTAGNGMKKAKELGAQYALKTRTDQRMYGRHIMEFLVNMIELFPPAPDSKQKKRLIGVGGGALKYNIYHFSDVFNFGQIDDMVTYWNPKLITTGDSEFKKEGYAYRLISESYLITEFLKVNGVETTMTNEDWWRSAGRYCVLVDTPSLDLYWPKYIKYREYRLISYIYPVKEVSFAEWINFYKKYN